MVWEVLSVFVEMSVPRSVGAALSSFDSIAESVGAGRKCLRVPTPILSVKVLTVHGRSEIDSVCVSYYFFEALSGIASQRLGSVGKIWFECRCEDDNNLDTVEIEVSRKRVTVQSDSSENCNQRPKTVVIE